MDHSLLKESDSASEDGVPASKIMARRSSSRSSLVLIGLLVMVALGGAIGGVVLAVRSAPSTSSGTSRHSAHGAVAADADVCSIAGVDVLKQGGAAADAAVTVALCLGVVHPFASGLGGGGFGCYYDAATQTATALNYRERAPAAATRTMYTGDADASKVGALAVAVPGELRGLWLMHERFGRLPWRRVVEPAADMARNGFHVDELLATDLKRHLTAIRAHASLAAELLKANGDAYAEGELMQRPALAATLEAVADDGADAFYTGAIAQRIVDDVTGAGGILSLDDLAQMNAAASDAQRVSFTTSHGASLEAHSAAPPAGGAAMVAHMLRVLDGNGTLATAPDDDLNASAAQYHRLVESLKFAFGYRTQLGDPDFYDISRVYPAMLGDAAAARVRSLLMPQTHADMQYYMPPDTPASFMTDSHGTSHFSVIDADGNAAAITTTVNLVFGSMLVSQGVVLNDQMDDFTTQPNATNSFGIPASVSNEIAPRKRPLSSIAPFIFTDGAGAGVRLVAGGSGGPMIVSAVIQAVLLVLERRLSPAAALDVPRLHEQLTPPTVLVEAAFSQALRDALAQRGHQVKQITGFLADGQPSGVVQLIQRTADGALHAASDYRKLGHAAQYKKR